MDIHSIAVPGLQAKVKSHGAELCSLQGAGIEAIWPAHTAWPRHSPVLFPIVGTLNHNRLTVDGHGYDMGRHGFARDRAFRLIGNTPESCRFELTDDAATRAIYPFAFRFEVAYTLSATGLEVGYTVCNPGATILPASFGAHPAFNWPLLPGVAKTAHRLTFAAPEPAPIRRIDANGLVRPDRLPSPIAGSVLTLRDDLFAEDAIILDQPASRSLRYGAPGTPSIEVAWEGFPELGIWTRPGVDLLCIEPWHGMSDPAGFEGEFQDKPGLMLIPPGDSRSARYTIRIIPGG